MTKRERTCVPQGRGLDLYYSPNPLECGGGEPNRRRVSHLYKEFVQFSGHAPETDRSSESKKIGSIRWVACVFARHQRSKGRPVASLFLFSLPTLCIPREGFLHNGRACDTDIDIMQDRLQVLFDRGSGFISWCCYPPTPRVELLSFH